MRVLILGAAGQVGRALVKSAPSSIDVIAADRRAIDVGEPASVMRDVVRLRPEAIINAAAYTAVDKAETDFDTARVANSEAPGFIARAAHQVRARLVHISTDFVFDGAAGTPYATDAPTAPVSVYGATKLAGELAALAETAGDAVIVRTGWVYAASGRNFLNAMLRLMRERGSVRVVDDQVGTPTAAASLAGALWALACAPRASGIYHWSDAGVASWYDFAVAIAEEAEELGLLSRTVEVAPIPSSEYPTAARRPSYSVLSKLRAVQEIGLVVTHWRKQLRAVMQEMQRA